MIDFLVGVLAVIGAGALWLKWAHAQYSDRAFPDEIHYVTTPDGWRIALSRYLPRGDVKFATPVICCHGVGCNALTFDFRKRSMARWLAARGHDVWAIDLRGHGFSEAPSSEGNRSYGWSCDTYLAEDMPTAIDYVCKHTGAPHLHWLGHSMGGNLGLAYLATGRGERIKSMITIASGLDYSESDSDYKAVIPMLRFFSWASSIPVGPIYSLLAPLVGRVPNPIEAFNYCPENMDPEVARAFHISGIHPVSTPVFEQLATLFDPGGMRPVGKDTHFFDGLVDVRTPVLTLAGEHDQQCPAVVCEKTHMWIGSEGKKLVIFGKAYGQNTHYGHLDLVFGLDAPKDVWPVVDEWLQK